MSWIFIFFFIAAVFHMVEEFIYPGGFANFLKRLKSRIAPLVTVPSIVVINELQSVLCIVGILVGSKNLILEFMRYSSIIGFEYNCVRTFFYSFRSGSHIYTHFSLKAGH